MRTSLRVALSPADAECRGFVLFIVTQVMKDCLHVGNESFKKAGLIISLLLPV
jgi:hypothetical protein